MSKMTIRHWRKMVIVNKKKDSENVKHKNSKCSKLKRAISHKFLGKGGSNNKEVLNTISNKSSVMLLSVINTSEHKNLAPRVENTISNNFAKKNLEEQFLLQPLDLVIQEAKHQLLLEKLSDKRSEKFEGMQQETYSSCSSRGSNSDYEEEDIYEEMDVLQSYFENIYTADYLEMGLV